MAVCEDPDFMFPMQASLYYPIVEQGNYGAIKKQWILDRVIACNFSSGGAAFKEEIKPNVNITTNSILVGRTKSDIRLSSREDSQAMTNILITDISDQTGNQIYTETSGPRLGKSTLFEIATFEPVTGAFGSIDHYRILIRRSENQTGDL